MGAPVGWFVHDMRVEIKYLAEPPEHRRGPVSARYGTPTGGRLHHPPAGDRVHSESHANGFSHHTGRTGNPSRDRCRSSRSGLNQWDGDFPEEKHPQSRPQQRTVTVVTVEIVTIEQSPSWLVMILQIPAQPSRHRVAVWRELRRFGAVPVAQGAWTAPDVPVCRAGAEKARELARAGDGELILLTTNASDPDAGTLRRLFDAARADEWAEFTADCGKFTEEIAREIAKGKFTLAELEEEEQSLERLRRWFRGNRSKAVFPSALIDGAEAELARCAAALEEFSDHVYRQVHQ